MKNVVLVGDPSRLLQLYGRLVLYRAVTMSSSNIETKVFLYGPHS